MKRPRQPLPNLEDQPIGNGAGAMLLRIYQAGIRAEAQNERIIAEQARASESRKEIYTRMTELTVEQARTTSELARLAPLVDAAELRRLELVGVWKLTRLGGKHMGKVGWAMVAAAGVWLAHALQDHLPDWLLRLFK